MPRKAKTDPEIEVGDPPTSIDVYATLGVTADATSDQVKSAYRKAALKYHPDKAAESDKAAAHRKFQEVAFAFAILSDERRRKRYDATGSTEESLDLDDDDFDWVTFFREQFAGVVTTDTINDFSRSYKGSEEEREHVLKAYERGQGRMDRIYSDVMLSDVIDDDERFRAIIDAAIASGEVEAYNGYTKETEKSKKARLQNAQKQRNKPMKSLEEMRAEIAQKNKPPSKSSKSEDSSSLSALIGQRQKARAGDFFDALEAKYAPKGGAQKKRSAEDEPSEEAFAKNRKKGKADGDGETSGTRKSKRSKQE